MAVAAAKTEMVGPTSQRVRRAASSGTAFDMPVEDRRVARRAWRMVNVVETMHREGKLCSDRWAAWQRFQRAWLASEIGPSVIQKYGDRFGSGGTPDWQVMAEAFDIADARESQRVLKRDQLRNALEAVSAPGLQRALVMAVGVECSLETIGRSVSRYADRGKAIAVAASMIEVGLWLLHCHYQAIHGQSSKVS